MVSFSPVEPSDLSVSGAARDESPVVSGADMVASLVRERLVAADVDAVSDVTGVTLAMMSELGYSIDPWDSADHQLRERVESVIAEVSSLLKVDPTP